MVEGRHYPLAPHAVVGFDLVPSLRLRPDGDLPPLGSIRPRGFPEGRRAERDATRVVWVLLGVRHLATEVLYLGGRGG